MLTTLNVDERMHSQTFIPRRGTAASPIAALLGGTRQTKLSIDPFKNPAPPRHPPKKLTVGTPKNERFLQVRFISFSRNTPCFEVPGWFVFGILVFDIHYDFPWNASDSDISIWRVGKVSPNIANPFVFRLLISFDVTFHVSC